MQPSILRIKYCVIAAPVWAFIVSLIIATQYSGYSHIGQHMSELAARYAPHNLWMSYVGLLPHGMLLLLGSLSLMANAERRARLPYGFLVLSAFCFMVLAVFPCDFGCPIHSSISFNAKVHHASAFLAFLFGMCAQIFLGSIYLEQRHNNYYHYCLLIGFISVCLYILMYLATIPYGTTFFASYKGLAQRAFMTNYALWLLLAVCLDKGKQHISGKSTKHLGRNFL